MEGFHEKKQNGNLWSQEFCSWFEKPCQAKAQAIKMPRRSVKTSGFLNLWLAIDTYSFDTRLSKLVFLCIFAKAQKNSHEKTL